MSEVPPAQWTRLSQLIGRSMGLNFPLQGRDSLQSGLTDATREFGFADAAECIDWLLSAPLNPSQLQVLASHLTVGETYFFREKQTMEALASHVLPRMIQARRGREQRLRIWSAGCCTGEEPYSLAILLQQCLPDWKAWDVRIVATDINPRFLKKAAEGIFGEWSFRNEPTGFKERHFSRTQDGRLAIAPEIKQMVTIAYLNLAEAPFPSKVIGTEAIDLILCRNVLMYFTPPQVRRVVGNFHRVLAEDGWLVVSPSEASKTLYPQFASVNFPGAILFQKGQAMPPAGSALPAPAPVMEPVAPVPEEASPEPREGPPADAEPFPLLARAFADQGELDEALACCDQWIAASKLDPAAHYVRGMILAERGVPLEARSSLQRSVYLHPDFTMAHFALGNLARSLGNTREAARHFANTLHLLGECPAEELLPESDGLTAGRLAQFIASMTAMESEP